MTQHSDNPVEEFVYGYRPSLVGSGIAFRLGPDALEWEGRRSGRIPYRRIARIRLMYRPATTQSNRFQAEIWGDDGQKVAIASASWKNMVQQETHDQPYAAFIRELHRRIAAAGGRPTLRAGSPLLLYWPGALILLGAAIGVPTMLAPAMRQSTWTGVALLAAFYAILIWQGGSFFFRNRPRRYAIDAIPREVIPALRPVPVG